MSIKRHGGERFQGKKQVDPFTQLIRGKDAKVDDVEFDPIGPGAPKIPPSVNAPDDTSPDELKRRGMDATERICSLCSRKFYGMGHNPEPLKPFEERCCSRCNEYRVIPARMRKLQKGDTQNRAIDTNTLKATMDVTKGDVPDRVVALQMYQSLLAATVAGRVNIVLAANQTAEQYPDCVVVGSIVHEAVHQINGRLAASEAEPLTLKETRQFQQLVNEELSRTFFAFLREARLFQFRERDYVRLYRMAQMHTCTSAGYKWKLPEPDHPEKQAPFEERKAVAEYTCAEGLKVPFPETTPFDSCYFAWGGGIAPTPVQCDLWGFDQTKVNLIMGTLITSDGWVFTLALRGAGDSVSIGGKTDVEMAHTVILERIGVRGGEQFKFDVSRLGKKPDNTDIGIMQPGWTLPFGLVPWMVAYTITLIDRMASLTKVSPHTLKERILFKTLSKRTGQRFLPPPYYPVLIQPSVFEEFEKKIESQARQWSHRWDVRGHYAYKLARGTLPLDPKVIHKLTKRRYVIFHALNRPTAEVLTVLTMRRVMPPREGEWIALLKSRKKAYIKGPKDKPYIPSLHRLKGGVPEVV